MTTTADRRGTVELEVKGMTCGSCAARVQKALSRTDGVDAVVGGRSSHGVQRLEQVRAVVLEPTGDMSVLTGDGGIDAELLSGVRGG